MTLGFAGAVVWRAIRDARAALWYSTYVTDRPRLSTYTDAEFARILEADIYPHFTRNGLAVREVGDLRVAWANSLDASWVLTFTATPMQIGTLLEGKTRLGGGEVLRGLRREGHIEVFYGFAKWRSPDPNVGDMYFIFLDRDRGHVWLMGAG